MLEKEIAELTEHIDEMIDNAGMPESKEPVHDKESDKESGSESEGQGSEPEKESQIEPEMIPQPYSRHDQEVRNVPCLQEQSVEGMTDNERKLVDDLSAGEEDLKGTPIFETPADIPALPEHSDDAFKFIIAGTKSDISDNMVDIPDKAGDGISDLISAKNKDTSRKLKRNINIKGTAKSIFTSIGAFMRWILPEIRNPEDMKEYMEPNMFSDNNRFVGDNVLTVKMTGDAGTKVDGVLNLKEPRQVTQSRSDMMSGRRNWQNSRSAQVGDMDPDDYKKAVINGIDPDMMMDDDHWKSDEVENDEERARPKR